ncbi:MAG: bacteriohemerythrin [Gracilibacter sp. BRH_c7a]|nr:MAG: bacteriohemerythrin [Gracilibacter sp. BRH_c7a]
MLVWKEEYAIGVESIDNQHKHLFEIGNSIYELLENYVLEDKYDRIINVLNDLREYTKYHFQSEEDYMIEIMYSGYFKQKVEHEDFIDKIEEIQLQDLDENQEKHIRELLLFVFNWILEHILQRDKLITA